MALGNAYDYIRKYVDKNFAYHDPFNTSYSSEDMIKDLEYVKSITGEDTKVILYYDFQEKALVFNDFDIEYSDFEIDPREDKYIEITIKHALNIFKLQNNMFYETLEEMKESGR